MIRTDTATLQRFVPSRVCQVQRGYVDGMARIKGIESFWSVLKRGHEDTLEQVARLPVGSSGSGCATVN